MTKDEKSLLLYLETRAVDHGGKIKDPNMNVQDWITFKKWVHTGYIEGGRICSQDIDREHFHWVHLSAQAMTDAHTLRRERAERMWQNKIYTTTQELQEP